LFVAAFAYLFAEELLLGTVASRGRQARVWLALAGRAIAFVCAALWDFVLHSGAILVILLALYLALFFLFQAAGDGHCATANRIGNCGGGLRCYTFGWFLPGDFPRHLNGSLDGKSLFARKFARRERVRDLSELPNMTEIAIVGGGPRVRCVASNWRAAGHSVSIFDEHLAWEKPCGGGLDAQGRGVLSFSARQSLS